MSGVNPYQLITREACKASIMLEGLTGRGKSGTALMLAFGLAGGFQRELTEEQQKELWKKVYAVDTENRSLNLMIGIPASFGGVFHQFFAAPLTPADGYAPSHYTRRREIALQQGADVWIGDSITHMWQGKGGVLDRVNDLQNDPDRRNPNKWSVWGEEEIVFEKNELLAVIRHPQLHVITTVRVKEKFESQQTDKGTKIVSLGEQQMQQGDLKYEPDLVLHMERAGHAEEGKIIHPRVRVIKSRYAIFNEGEEYDLTPERCEELRAYLAEGEDPAKLLEMQRQEYIQALADLMDSNITKKSIWPTIKAELGQENVSLKDLPLNAVKKAWAYMMDED